MTEDIEEIREDALKIVSNTIMKHASDEKGYNAKLASATAMYFCEGLLYTLLAISDLGEQDHFFTVKKMTLEYIENLMQRVEDITYE